MSILVVAEQKNEVLKKVSREMVSAARALGGTVVALLINGTDEHAHELFSAGADTVIKNGLNEFSPQGYANTIAAVAGKVGAKLVIAPHSSQGKDYAGRVAVKLRAAIAADVTLLKGTLEEIEVVRPVYSGKAYAGIKIKTPAVITLRPNSQEILSYKGKETIEASDATEGNVTAKLTDIEISGTAAVQLSDASIVVSGGRGIKGPENWPLLQELTDVLGAALGASRAAVDAGWISHSHQVGQTGKTVSPNCYIACGISGAIQHLAGMSSSKYIVAINKDPDAPIFKHATYGIVDDLFEVVPALTAELKKILS